MSIWRAGDLLLPLRATSSYHRCRSKAGWRDRQVLSGCRSIDIASATYVNGRSKVALKKGGISVPACGGSCGAGFAAVHPFSPPHRFIWR
jgi:hypothetical protein